MLGTSRVAVGGLFDAERRGEAMRIARHLRRAELAARCAPRALGPLRRVVRSLLLGELARYRAAGRYPKNQIYREPTPFFVDAAGTRCAVAHLLDVSGEHALVERIAKERNHAKVRELADEPRLRSWLHAAGLTLDEAALIQPSYCFDERSCVCGRSSAGYLEVVTTTEPTNGTAKARVERIHGAPQRTDLVVGSEVLVKSYRLPVGEELVLFGNVDHFQPDGSDVYVGVTFPRSCGSAPPLDKQQYLQAKLATDCEATLYAMSEEWVPDCDDGCSCRAVGGGRGQPTTLGILGALLGVVVARRMRRSGAVLSGR